MPHKRHIVRVSDCTLFIGLSRRFLLGVRSSEPLRGVITLFFSLLCPSTKIRSVRVFVRQLVCRLRAFRYAQHRFLRAVLTQDFLKEVADTFRFLQALFSFEFVFRDPRQSISEALVCFQSICDARFFLYRSFISRTVSPVPITGRPRYVGKISIPTTC